MSVPDDLRTIQDIAEQENFLVNRYDALSGGSINQVYLLETSEGKRVLKVNEKKRFPGMFQAEKEGLQELKKSKTFQVPEVYQAGSIGTRAYLLMEYLEKSALRPDFWENFAENLAAMHKTSASTFGFPRPNYIGSLPQYNHTHESAAGFYISERLEPQFKIALDNGYPFHDLETVFKHIVQLIPEEAPSLLHGDLWSGNYLVSNTGLPALIDPAVAYGPREMDLAMMKLFGGFPEEVFEMYEATFPLAAGFKDRVALWQLYYLLVHLNIFGKGYLPQVQHILDQYS